MEYLASRKSKVHHRRSRGHIRARGEDSWAIIIELPRDPQFPQRRQQRWATYHGDREGAEKELTRLLHEADSGKILVKKSEANNQTLQIYLEQWIEDRSASKALPERTLVGYRRNLQTWVYPRIGDTALRDITPDTIQGLIRDLATAPNKKAKDPKKETLSPQTVRRTAWHRLFLIEAKGSRRPFRGITYPGCCRSAKSIHIEMGLGRWYPDITT